MSSSSLSSLSPSPAPSSSESKGPSMIVRLKIKSNTLKMIFQSEDKKEPTSTGNNAGSALCPLPESAAGAETPAPAGVAAQQNGVPSSPIVVPAVAAATATATAAAAAVVSAVAAASPANSEIPNPATPLPANGNGNGTPTAANGKKRGKGAGPGARPGPKPKRQKLDGQSPAGSINGAVGPPHPHPKLGPKSNQGAINAQLRALDRTGTPCRRWKKAEFKLKSFTGVEWAINSFRTELAKASEEASESNGTPASEPTNEPTPMEGVEETNGVKPEMMNSPMVAAL